MLCNALMLLCFKSKLNGKTFLKMNSTVSFKLTMISKKLFQTNIAMASGFQLLRPTLVLLKLLTLVLLKLLMFQSPSETTWAEA